MSRGRGRRFLLVSIALAASAAPASCLSQPDLPELLKQPVTVTKRDTTVDFASYKTFAVTETIPLLSAVGAGPATMSVDPSLAQPTLDDIAREFANRGYVRVTKTETPDLGVAVTAVNRLQVYTITYGGWWGAGGGTTPTYWGLGGGFTTAFGYSTVAWQSGTLIIELYDLRAARAQETAVGPSTPGSLPTNSTIPIIWAAVLHGVVGPPGASLSAPPTAEIQQAFVQSPYLVRGAPVPEVIQ